MIKLRKIDKIFTTDTVKTTALAKVDVSIGKGEFIAIVGPSGSGKSTLMNILGFIDTPTGGSYMFDGEETAKLKESQRLAFRRHVGFIFQKFNLIESLSIVENIRIPLLSKRLSKREQDNKVKVILEKMGISHRGEHRPYQLSGGQQQRVAIARALVGEPKLVLADEPTGNLDSKNGEETFNSLKEAHNEGATIVMVTHDQGLANAADRQIHIRDGTIWTEPNREVDPIDWTAEQLC